MRPGVWSPPVVPSVVEQVVFRARLIEANLDRRLVERTVEVITATKGFGPRALRAGLDSSPLWGAGRVEDTDNLLGHAVGRAWGGIARAPGRREPVAVLAEQAGAPVLGGSSLKAALDLDCDDPTARDQALVQRDLDSGLVPAGGLTPANAPQSSVTDAITTDLDAQHARLAELHFDHGELTCPHQVTMPFEPVRSAPPRGRAQPARHRPPPHS